MRRNMNKHTLPLPLTTKRPRWAVHSRKTIRSISYMTAEAEQVKALQAFKEQAGDDPGVELVVSPWA